MMPDSLSTPCYPSNEGEKEKSRARPRNSPPFSWLSPVPSLLVSSRGGQHATARSHSQATRPRTAQLRTQAPNGCVTPLPAAFRRSRAVVRASSSSSSSSSSGVSSSSSAPKARFVARRSESAPVQQLARPLAEYMSLPASQWSVLDAERIERVDDSTFRCYVYRFFALEVCPVLLVRVDEEPDGCCIRLLSCKLEGSPLVEAQNDKFFKAKCVCRTCSSASQLPPQPMDIQNIHKLSELSSSSSIASEGLPLPFDKDVLIHTNSNIATKRTQLSSLLVAF